MVLDPAGALAAATRPGPARAASPGTRVPGVLVAGGTGTLGNEVLHRLAGAQRHAWVGVLVREPMRAGLRGVLPVEVPEGAPAGWPARPLQAQRAVLLFEPASGRHGRERALWTPEPADLLPLARWLHAGGVDTLVLVLPHEQGRLPDALRRGLANLDEHGVAALGFARVLVVRSARAPAKAEGLSWPERLAAAMLSIFKYMVPEGDKPVRPARLAEVIEAALEVAPPGVRVLPPELVAQAARGEPRAVLGEAWQSTAKSRDFPSA